jgi:hypothetical protein
VVELDCGVGWEVGVDDDVAGILGLVLSEIVGLHKYHDHVALAALFAKFFGTGNREGGHSFGELLDFGVHFFEGSYGDNHLLVFGCFQIKSWFSL